jgi:hypothetical protein
MPQGSSPVLKARSALGVATRRRDPEAITEGRRNLATEKIANYVKQTLAEAPPLTDAQRIRLAELLRPVRNGGAGA